jgi:hypothetical protein
MARASLIVRSICSLLFSLLFTAAAVANDAYFDGVGGAMGALPEHPTIRMVAKKVTADIWQNRAEVDCRFTFHNAGPATTVRMGFPEEGSGDVDPNNPRGFTHFATWVDGRRVPARIAELKKGYYD